MLSREPSGDRIARSCRHTAPDLTVKTEVKDGIAKSLLSQHVLGFWGPLHILRQCRSLSQRSCRLSRDRRQLRRRLICPGVWKRGSKKGLSSGTCLVFPGTFPFTFGTEKEHPKELRHKTPSPNVLSRTVPFGK